MLSVLLQIIFASYYEKEMADSGKDDANHYLEVLTDLVVEVAGKFTDMDTDIQSLKDGNYGN